MSTRESGMKWLIVDTSTETVTGEIMNSTRKRNNKCLLLMMDGEIQATKRKNRIIAIGGESHKNPIITNDGWGDS